MAQSWHDLLFAHWPVPAEVLRPLIPEPLAIDTFDGQGWIGVVPFRMSGIRPRGGPALPWLSAFPELNVRTYVTLDARPGVWFFSLEAANPIAVAVARWWFHLPYFNATMRCQRSGDDIDYASLRTHRRAADASFAARYGPTGPVTLAPAGSHEHWLTERYCLYSVNRKGDLVRGDIHHEPWPLQPATWTPRENRMTEPLGIELPGTKPLLRFARRLDVVVWPPRRLGPPTT
ncbi:hypothetical protein Pan216_14280 [Planctomycetes bacterium Pan216]|uniref:DUF2071 domain-containing protein n=1 Tax=Kolteria novifilia TaxID=2527975 RepID=A0A518B0S2_9BACT|nr:hypothetical protein Pan216_14280 [Planctomycetes bacterium Pan216]